MSDKAEEGTVVLAHYQNKGRGQSGNFWESERGKNILASIILFPEFIPAHQQFYLSKITSLAIFDFLKSKIDNISIKWPNDIYIGNRKIAGILIENSVKGGYLSSTILGMGININQQKFSKELANPVSLKQLLGKEYSIEELAHQLIDQIFKWYHKLRTGQLDEINESYLNHLYRKNVWSLFMKEGEKFEARITGTNEYGQLLLEDRKCNTKAYLFKEVEFIL